MPRGGNHCDFCGALFVSKLYACRNFMWDGRNVFQGDSGRWAACSTCAALIDVGDWDKVAARVLREVKKRKGITLEEVAIARGELRLLFYTLRVHFILGTALIVKQPLFAKITAPD